MSVEKVSSLNPGKFLRRKKEKEKSIGYNLVQDVDINKYVPLKILVSPLTGPSNY